jgi:sialate O-acetylesterase
MELKVMQADNSEEAIKNAYNSNIRMFNVPQNKSLKPLENTMPALWKICDSTSIKETSAVAYYYAKKLQHDLNIPIGILQSTWGGTPVEAWTSREMLMTDSISKKKLLANDSVTVDDFVKDSLDLVTYWDIVYNVKNGLDTVIPLADYDDRDWKNVEVPGVISVWEPDFYEGIFWLRKKITLDKDFVGKELTLNLGHPEINYTLYFNGKEICKTQWNANLSHKYKIPADVVKEGENTIVLRMAALWGAGGLKAPADEIYLVDENAKTAQVFPLTGTWKYKKDLEPAIPTIHNFQYYPTYLFNAMINPVIPYSVKGFIWYQGESNDTAAYHYRDVFPLLIKNWRNRWQQGDLPFLFVQLPNYNSMPDDPKDEKWAVMRESQSKALALPNTGMTCIIDLGNPNNIHPTNKTDVGNRLAKVSEKLVYDMKIQASGPVMKGFAITGNHVVVSFAEIGEGLFTSDNKPVKGFSVAGEDGKYYPAYGVISGNSVVLTAKKVQTPVAVRYAWENNPDCNLVNSNGLPALPFRTDDWKVQTQK